MLTFVGVESDGRFPDRPGADVTARIPVMSRLSSLAIHTRQRRPVQRPDRLPIPLAAPIVLVLSLLCWLAVWQVARLVF